MNIFEKCFSKSAFTSGQKIYKFSDSCRVLIELAHPKWVFQIDSFQNSGYFTGCGPKFKKGAIYWFKQMLYV